MYAWYLKLAISCASLMFIAGFISLLVLSVTKVSPARKGLNFEEVNCRVTDSEISCESGNCTCIRDTNTAQTPCLKVYVSCGGGVEAIGNRSFSASKQEGYLLRRDVHHLNDECSFKGDSNICNLGLASPQDLEKYRLQRGRPGAMVKCYRNPKVPDVVVSENHSKEHYRNVVLHCVLWPLALIGLSIVILTTVMCLRPARKEYRRMP